MNGSKKISMVAVAVAALVSGCAGRAGDLPGPDELVGPGGEAGRRFSQTFTTTEDFKVGAANGVTDDSAGQLQMSIGQTSFQTPYMWVPNSTDNSITLIDTIKNEVIGTYPLVDANGETCWNPSRTTVDFNWDVWVGCRGTNSYINGRMGRSIQEVDNKVMKVSFKTGKVLLSVRVGNAPRAVAIDAENHVWIGASADDSVWEIDGDTGQCYRGNGCPNPAIAVPDFPYGAVVDQDARLWLIHNKVTTDDQDQISSIDTKTGAVLGIYGPFKRGASGTCVGLYGIAIDQMGDVWLGGAECHDAVKVNGKTGVMIGAYNVGGNFTRGVAIDLDGNVWAATSGTQTITKLNGATGALITTVGVQESPIGVAVDAYGHIWAVNYGSNSVTKVNGLKLTTTQTTVGKNPYSYSDMMGLALRTITLRKKTVATWRAVVDSGRPSAHFTDVAWGVTIPPATGFAMRVRCADTRDNLAVTPFGPEMAAPGPVTCGAGEQFMEVEARFTADGTSASPVLDDLTVHWEG